MNTMLDVPILKDVVNMASRGVLEHHVGCCNYENNTTALF